jgi:hypothetical protein
MKDLAMIVICKFRRCHLCGNSLTRTSYNLALAEASSLNKQASLMPNWSVGHIREPINSSQWYVNLIKVVKYAVLKRCTISEVAALRNHK